jgi:hypothetical protein
MCEMFTKFLLLEAKVTIGDSSISCLKGKKWIKKNTCFVNYNFCDDYLISSSSVYICISVNSSGLRISSLYSMGKNNIWWGSNVNVIENTVCELLSPSSVVIFDTKHSFFPWMFLLYNLLNSPNIFRLALGVFSMETISAKKKC